MAKAKPSGNEAKEILTPDVIKKLIEAAMDAREKAYAPYSNFKVGAAILCEGGHLFSGANVENASYGAGICAERTAATSAVSSGFQKFLAVAICGWGEDASEKKKVMAYPCGICRQFLHEFAASDMQVIVAKNVDDYESYFFSDLLPLGFGPDALN